MNEQEDEVAHPGTGNNTSQATVFRPIWQFAMDRQPTAASRMKPPLVIGVMVVVRLRVNWVLQTRDVTCFGAPPDHPFRGNVLRIAVGHRCPGSLMSAIHCATRCQRGTRRRPGRDMNTTRPRPHSQVKQRPKNRRDAGLAVHRRPTGYLRRRIEGRMLEYTTRHCRAPFWNGSPYA